MCPVCTVAVGLGLGLSRWLKIDDTVSGIWIGALILSLSFLSAKWTKRFVSIRLRYLTLLYVVSLFAITFIPLWYSGVIGNPLNRYWGMDKLLFGTAIGCVVFPLFLGMNGWLKRLHHGKVYFPFQKVIIPVFGLICASIGMYLMTK